MGVSFADRLSRSSCPAPLYPTDFFKQVNQKTSGASFFIDSFEQIFFSKVSKVTVRLPTFNYGSGGAGSAGVRIPRIDFFSAVREGVRGVWGAEPPS